MAILRDEPAAVPIARLTAAWPHDPVQRDRALSGLIADGLVEPEDVEHYRLPQA
jgi:A/G-specific adenine glycosylase